MKTYLRVQEVLRADLARGLSVNQIVRKTGLTHNTVGTYLDGRAEPTQHSLEKLSAAYHVSIAWLRGDTDNSVLAAAPSSALVDVSTLSDEKRELWERLQTVPEQKLSKLLDLWSILEKDE